MDGKVISHCRLCGSNETTIITEVYLKKEMKLQKKVLGI